MSMTCKHQPQGTMSFSGRLTKGDMQQSASSRRKVMSEKMQSGQSGSKGQKDQQFSDEQRRREKEMQETSKPGHPPDTGSTSNSQPGSGAG
jgi:hypothetical protein